MKLKYELEKNVNLVSFENNRIEISFNDNLDRNFVKEISYKLFEWTGKRWIIMFSKMTGFKSIKQKNKNLEKKYIDDLKKSSTYEEALEVFPDLEILSVNNLEDND